MIIHNGTMGDITYGFVKEKEKETKIIRHTLTKEQKNKKELMIINLRVRQLDAQRTD